MRLKDKVAIVTGASSDIGIAICKKFAQEGANVVLLGRDIVKLENARKTITDYPSRTAAIACDITAESQVIQTINQIADHYGKIDILVNNAGIMTDPIHFHEMPSEDLNILINTNLFGTFKITRSAIIKMLENTQGGSIINIGSISAERAIPKVHLTAYCTTKAAINMFTKGLAVEYARRNIRCNCVNPGIVNAGMMKSYLDFPDAKKILEDKQPLNKIGEPEDVANAVVFLASEEAKWISGIILNVDGGKSASE